MPGSAETEIVTRLRADLPVALRARDQVATRAIRTALAAVANAEAVPVPEPRGSLDPPVVGASQEVERRQLDAADVERILVEELADRRDTIERYEAHGRTAEADELRAELAVLARYLPAGPPPD